jgi:hypothetical protein
MGLFEKHINDLEDFKEKVTKKLRSVCKEMSDLRTMFIDFEKD